VGKEERDGLAATSFVVSFLRSGQATGDGRRIIKRGCDCECDEGKNKVQEEEDREENEEARKVGTTMGYTARTETTRECV
jgi:hypothetical protein